MKTPKITKIIALIVGIFIISAVATQAVFQPAFSGPSSSNAPAYGTVGSSEMNLNTNEQDYIDPIGSTLSVLGRSLSITSINPLGLVTDGVFSFGPIRAVGKLTGTLRPTTLTGPSAREVMHLKGGYDSGLISFLTNTSYLGFWGISNYCDDPTECASAPSYPEPYPQFIDTIGLSSSNAIWDKMITNLIFGRVNIKHTVVSPYLPYAQVPTDLTLYGTTNLGAGPVCFIPATYTFGTPYANVQYKCPPGWVLKSPGTAIVYHPGQGSATTATINGTTVNIPANTPAVACQRISPTPIPGSNHNNYSYYYQDSTFNWCNSSATGTPPPPPPPPTTGSLTITITPAGAITAGAKWQLDGTGTLRTSGTTVTGITPGSHFVKCTTTTGYNAPANIPVTITAGTTTTANCNYTAATPPPTTGSLTVTMTPSAAVSAGAKWQLDGVGTLYNSGQTITGVSAGSHFVKYSSLFPTYTTPANSNVTVPAGGSTTATGNYVLAPYDIVQQTAYYKTGTYQIYHKLCLNPAKYTSPSMNTTARTLGLLSNWHNAPGGNTWSHMYYNTVYIPAGQLCSSPGFPFYLTFQYGMYLMSPMSFGQLPSSGAIPNWIPWSVSVLSSGLTVDPAFTGH